MIPTVEWKDGAVRLLDQSLLPGEVRFLDCRDYREVAEAIRELKVRGAPAIGVTAAMGLALGAQALEASDFETFSKGAALIGEHLAATRPTAVNLFWAIRRMISFLEQSRGLSVCDVKRAMVAESQRILDEDVAMNRAMGRHGAALIKSGQTVLTHCNAGALATAGYGTALGVIRAAWESGKKINVIADETRPVLQGARLTAWELMQDKIPVTLITDNMAGSLMRQGRIDLCVVGADRIAANGDVANKIGTYSVAVLAKAHGIPFYVAAPYSTIDLSTRSGADIPIEQRRAEEVTTLYQGRRTAPEGVEVLNPAFDVTPARYITGIITERGVFKPSAIMKGFNDVTGRRLGRRNRSQGRSGRRRPPGRK
jgi:methylthioribose-1-phosphate isomerase